MKIKFLEAAQFELDEAIEFYNHEHPGLGNQLLQTWSYPAFHQYVKQGVYSSIWCGDVT